MRALDPYPTIRGDSKPPPTNARMAKVVAAVRRLKAGT
jgi:hypothetical protein